MKVVIFGGSGFLGSHIMDVLLERGYEAAVFDLVPSPYLKIKSAENMIVGDILDSKLVDSVTAGADIVYNLAGISDIDEAKLKPIETIRQNVLGNSIILDACRKNKIKRFLFASSIYVYSNSGSFYRTSKKACELIIEDYQKNYGLDFTIMRYGSLYGPRTDERNWIYAMLRQAVEEGKITRKGDGEEIREYIHVHDAAKMSVDMLDEEFNNQYVIVSGNQTIKIKDLLIMVSEMLNGKIEVEYIPSKEEEHYEITPYSFSPKIAKKIISNSYLDLGQGILDLLGGVHNRFSENGKPEEIRAKGKNSGY